MVRLLLTGGFVIMTVERRSCCASVSRNNFVLGFKLGFLFLVGFGFLLGFQHLSRSRRRRILRCHEYLFKKK